MNPRNRESERLMWGGCGRSLPRRGQKQIGTEQRFGIACHSETTPPRWETEDLFIATSTRFPPGANQQSPSFAKAILPLRDPILHRAIAKHCPSLALVVDNPNAAGTQPPSSQTGFHAETLSDAEKSLIDPRPIRGHRIRTPRSSASPRETLPSRSLRARRRDRTEVNSTLFRDCAEKSGPAGSEARETFGPAMDGVRRLAPHIDNNVSMPGP